MIRRFLAVVLVFVVALLVTPRVAGAQTAADSARATQLKKQGDDLVHSLHYREALAAYDEAFAISHDPAIFYNRARALDALGETPQALDAYEEFIRVAPASLKAKVPKLDELVAAVRARVATLVIHCPIMGANVLVRRRVEGTTPLAAPLRVRTGPAVIEVQADGFQPFHAELVLAGGAPTTLDVALVKDEPTPVVVAPAPIATPIAMPAPRDDSEKAAGTGWKWAAYTAGGVGVLGIASGAIFGVLALTKQNDADAHCPGQTCDPTGSQLIADARTFATVSTVSFIVGGVGLVTSVLLFLGKPAPTNTQGRLVPVMGPGFGGLAGAF